MRDTVRLKWQGHETIEAAQLLLLQAAQIEIVLPQDYNYVLYQALHPEDKATPNEINNVEGGPELLNNIAKIDGLGELSELVEWLVELDATVHVFAPPAVVILIPSERVLH